MDGEDYTYVNGEGDYRGNILLDPQGTPTRAEMYSAIAEVCRPVEIVPTMPEWAAGLLLAMAVAVCAIAVCELVRTARGLE